MAPKKPGQSRPSPDCCRFEGNLFCSRLDCGARDKLCPVCHIERLRADSRIDLVHSQDSPVLFLGGLASIRKSSESSDTFRILAPLSTPGTLVSSGSLLPSPLGAAGLHLDVICDSFVAVFEAQVAAELYETNISFCQAMLLSIAASRAADFRVASSDKVYDHVLFVLEMAKAAGVPELTHEQISRACGHSRPAVTRAMQKILANEPGLFKTPPPQENFR